MIETPPLDIRFFVPGVPVPKGSHQAFPISKGECKACKPGKPCHARNCFRGILVGTVVTDQQGGELEAWQAMVKVTALSARNAARQRLVSKPGAVSISIVFVFARPDGHWKETPGALSLEGRRKPLPTVKPDKDKLTRAVFDGLTGVLAEDDSQFASGRYAKVYAPWRGKTGAVVRARQFSASEEWAVDELRHAGLAGAGPLPQASLI